MIRACILALVIAAAAHAGEFTVRSVGDGKWSSPATWSTGRPPRAGETVFIAPHTQVIYDIQSDDLIPLLQVAGTLRFAPDKNTTLTVCILKVGSEADAGLGVEDPDHHRHPTAPAEGGPRPLLEIGSVSEPIRAPNVARIRLALAEGYDPAQAPALVCRPGAAMELHGQPLVRTWVKLFAEAGVGATTVKLAEPVFDWRTGDLLLLTGAIRRAIYDGIKPGSEERKIAAISDDGRIITLDEPLNNIHYGAGDNASEIADLTRSVVVESADPNRATGHTMYHRGSAGSISYARFSRLGKYGSLGRYPIHFHKVRDSMRGTSVIGAVIDHSLNRWIVVHGSDYLVIRDCIGYGSLGHGFFMEDGSEVYNLFDRNLGTGATWAARLPQQVIDQDSNEGAAFWWANPRNSWVRNVTCENLRYGFHMDCRHSERFSTTLAIRQSDGSFQSVDIRTLPLYRFDSNESHTEGQYGLALGGTEGLGPDSRHPHIVRNYSAWRCLYGFKPDLPMLRAEDLSIRITPYGIYAPRLDHHEYRHVMLNQTTIKPFDRGMGERSTQQGPVAIDGITFLNCGVDGSLPLFQISDNNPTGKAQTHIRDMVVQSRADEEDRSWFDRGGLEQVDRITELGSPVFLHEPGIVGKYVSVQDEGSMRDRRVYLFEPPYTGQGVRSAVARNVAFPKILDPVDDDPPVTVITYPIQGATVPISGGRLVISGAATDNAKILRVVVNGEEARDLGFNFHQWQAKLTGLRPGPLALTAYGVDSAGNDEKTPHRITVQLVESKERQAPVAWKMLEIAK